MIEESIENSYFLSIYLFFFFLVYSLLSYLLLLTLILPLQVTGAHGYGVVLLLINCNLSVESIKSSILSPIPSSLETTVFPFHFYKYITVTFDHSSIYFTNNNTTITIKLKKI